MTYDYRCIVVAVDTEQSILGNDFNPQSVSAHINHSIERFERAGWEYTGMQASWCGSKQITYIWVRRERKDLAKEAIADIPDSVPEDIEKNEGEDVPS